MCETGFTGSKTYKCTQTGSTAVWVEIVAASTCTGMLCIGGFYHGGGRAVAVCGIMHAFLSDHTVTKLKQYDSHIATCMSAALLIG